MECAVCAVSCERTLNASYQGVGPCFVLKGRMKLYGDCNKLSRLQGICRIATRPQISTNLKHCPA